VKLDWTGAPCTAALPAMAVIMTNGAKMGRPGGMDPRRLDATVVAMLLIYGRGSAYLVLGCRASLRQAHRSRPGRLARPERAYRRHRQRLSQGNGPRRAHVGMDRYAIASELAFTRRAHTPGLATANSHLFGGMG